MINKKAGCDKDENIILFSLFSADNTKYTQVHFQLVN